MTTTLTQPSSPNSSYFNILFPTLIIMIIPRAASTFIPPDHTKKTLVNFYQYNPLRAACPLQGGVPPEGDVPLRAADGPSMTWCSCHRCAGGSHTRPHNNQYSYFPPSVSLSLSPSSLERTHARDRCVCMWSVRGCGAHNGCDLGHGPGTGTCWVILLRISPRQPQGTRVVREAGTPPQGTRGVWPPGARTMATKAVVTSQVWPARRPRMMVITSHFRTILMLTVSHCRGTEACLGTPFVLLGLLEIEISLLR